MDFYPGEGWNLGFTLQSAELDNSVGHVDRRAVSLNGGRTSNDTQWQSKLEWREDTGAERREQWVTTNRLLHRINESLRIAARLNIRRPKTRSIRRPAQVHRRQRRLRLAAVRHTRWALLGKLTYLYDVSALEQVGDNVAFYDQKSQILSLEGIYKPTQHWEFAGKAMRREGEVRFGRLAGEWADSGATFLAGQARYEFADVWHALAEYRWLGVEDGGARQGALIGIDRDFGKHFRVGVGYNFTDFSDDLTDFDYDHNGVYLNVVGSY